MLEMLQNKQDGKSHIMLQNEPTIHPKSLLKFWEADHFFKCPLIGMCLVLSEQKRLLRKTGISIKKKSPYEIHEILVGCSESENKLSRKVDNYLNRNFGKAAVLLLELGHEKFMADFKSAFQKGDFKAFLWAAAISPELPVAVKRELFGEIHMSMHSSSEASGKLKRKIHMQQKQISDLSQGIKDAVKVRRSLQKENENLRQNRTDLKAKITIAEREKSKTEAALAELSTRHRFTDLEQENQMLKKKLNSLIATEDKEKKKVVSLQKRNTLLSLNLEQQQESGRRYRKEAQKIIGEVVGLNHCDTACPSFDLCRKRILIVGGIERMESLYRELIESSGGIFEYHDGYMKKGVKNLEHRLRRADIILCPVNCNSHAACSLVKNLGKKHNKPVHMMANFSLNAISHMIGGSDQNSNRQN